MNESTSRDKLYRVFDGKGPVTGADRVWALGLVGSSQAAIAEALSVSRTTVNKIIHDQEVSANVATKVAEVTGLSLKRLWPCGKYSAAAAERRAKTQALKQAA